MLRTFVRYGVPEVTVEPACRETEIPLKNAERLGGLIGQSASMRRLFTLIERTAPTDCTVLVEGQTGTGKEILARTIHERSPRYKGPFIVIDCAATAESLLESELFGHVKGAFTGAINSRDGALRRARGGTVFIDELTSLPLTLQGKLLRALETRRIHPVGADHEVDVDLRIVAAANRPLSDEVKAGRFREDLYFRLCVVRMVLPPLRDRREDIPLIAKHFLRSAGLECNVEGPNLDRLVGYAWPGNVRELRNTLQRALALAGSRDISFGQLPIHLGETTADFAWPVALEAPFKQSKDQLVEAFERVYVSQLLRRFSGNISEAARRAGVSRRHFFRLLRKHAALPRMEARAAG